MAQYKTGTVSVTNGSNVVTGTGTAWLANVYEGCLFTKAGDIPAYTVASVISDTSLTLTGNYGGTTSSGSEYGITVNFTEGGIPLLSPQDLNTSAIYNEAMKNISNFNNSLGIEKGSFTPSFVASYGTTVTEGASSSFSGTYEKIGDYVSIEVVIDLDTSTPPVVGDRLLFDGIPSNIYPYDNRTSMGIAECYGSFVNGNHAFYQATPQADGQFGITCQNVFGSITYQGILHISLRYKVA